MSSRWLCPCWTWILVWCLVVSCQPEADLEVMLPIQKNEWPHAKPVVIQYQNTDTLRPRLILLRFRHNGDYPYRNLHTLCHIIGPEGDSMTLQRETIFSDPEGQWLGQSSMGDLYMVSDTMVHDLRLRRTGLYLFKIYQHMRINPVPSVAEVGLSIR